MLFDNSWLVCWCCWNWLLSVYRKHIDVYVMNGEVLCVRASEYVIYVVFFSFQFVWRLQVARTKIYYWYILDFMRAHTHIYVYWELCRHLNGISTAIAFTANHGTASALALISYHFLYFTIANGIFLLMAQCASVLIMRKSFQQKGES